MTISQTTVSNDDAINTGAVLRIAVGSSNPAKIRAVEQALQRALSSKTSEAVSMDLQGNKTSQVVSMDLHGFDVDSGVRDQPFGDEETKEGAQNRAKAAYKAYRAKHGKHPHFAVGMEGGLEWMNNNETSLYCMAWMAVYGKRQAFVVELFASQAATTYFGDKKPIFGLAKTACFSIPPAIAKHVREGMELGDADDKVFGRVKSKHGSGTVGILTDGHIDRSEYYEHAIILAMTPWIRPDVYPEGSV